MSAVTLTDALLATSAPVESPGRSSADAGSRFGDALDAAGETFSAEQVSSDPVDGTTDAGAVPVGEETEGEKGAGLVSAALALLLALPTIDGGEPAAEEADPSDAGVRLDTDDPAVESARTDGSAPGAHPSAPGLSSITDQAAATASVGSTAPTSADPAADAPARSDGADAARPTTPDADPLRGPERISAAPSAPVPTAAPAPRVSGDAPAPVDADARRTAETSASSVPADRAVSLDRAPAVDRPAPPAASVSSAVVAVSPVAAPTASLGVAPTDAPADVAPAPRAVAAQVSPVVVSIAQRPSGTHQLTMTVNPDTLGPVTVRAHIGQAGDVRVELIGATDAGRDALRAIVTDLRRDLAAAMPHASLSIAQGAASDAGADRNAPPLGGGGAEGGTSNGRGTASDSSPHAPRHEAASAPVASAPTDRDPAAVGLDILA
ncbi:hypothetical protein RAC69_02475 [Microbacterium sp. LS_15]|uniref:hypothetical protein n=1 Tax=Microbacterium sp. LS_15 TaxID=3055790 RepID=UPI0035C026E2